jgi:hypothetical protein
MTLKSGKSETGTLWPQEAQKAQGPEGGERSGRTGKRGRIEKTEIGKLNPSYRRQRSGKPEFFATKTERSDRSILQKATKGTELKNFEIAKH